MQHPSISYRGGIRIGHHYVPDHHTQNGDKNDENSSVSNSVSDEKDDNNSDIKFESIYPSTEVNSDFELAIRNLRPSATRQKKSKINSNVSKQKADLPQLNVTNDMNHNNQSNERKQDDNNRQNKQICEWFPKPDIGHVDSNDFIRHNHVG